MAFDGAAQGVADDDGQVVGGMSRIFEFDAGAWAAELVLHSSAPTYESPRLECGGAVKVLRATDFSVTVANLACRAAVFWRPAAVLGLADRRVVAV